MQSNIERQALHPSESLGVLRLTVNALVDEAERERTKRGQEIREQTRIAVSNIEQGLLPRFIDVDEVTQHDQKDPTKLLIVQYDTRNNQLLLVRRAQGRYGDGEIKTLEDKDWIQHGKSLARALETAEYTAQQAKTQ